MRSLASALGVTLVVGGATPASGQPSGDLLTLTGLATGLEMLVGLADSGDGSGRLFLVEQGGRVWTFDGEALSDEPFLDLSDRVGCCGERGLFSVVFHPEFAENGRLFASYTDPSGDSLLTELRMDGDPADPLARPDRGSELELLRVPQPASNHNGGHLAFGPDGMLYYGLGDGGGLGREESAQRLDRLVGKLLRLDVDSATPYAIPADNPFATRAAARGEIWLLGFRNPWRFSFDRETGDLYIGDVGERRFEEIDLQPAGLGGGTNFGWGIKEGAACFEPAAGCDETGLTDPVLVYTHDLGCSVTGGYRYRGPSAPTLSRAYLYGDYCSGRMWGAVSTTQGVFRSRELLRSDLALVSFGEDASGRLYALDYGGRLYRIEGAPLFASDFETVDLADWGAVRGGAVASAPGLGGSANALALELDGRGRRVFVRSGRPRREETFEACFDLDPGTADLAGARVELLRLRGGGAHLRLSLEARGAGYRAVLEVRESGGRFAEAGGVSLKAGREARLCVDWFRATSDGSADGEARLSRNGRVRAIARRLANHRYTVDSVLLGLPGGSRGATGGILRIDNYASSP